jgi:hypothetical protein
LDAETTQRERIAADEFMRHEAGLAKRCNCSIRTLSPRLPHEWYCLAAGGDGVLPVFNAPPEVLR